MPLRPCLERGCREYTTGSRCTRHQAEWQRRRRQRIAYGEITGSRGSNWDWLVLRAKALHRDQNTCQGCGHTARDMVLTQARDKLEVHHIDRNSRHNVLENLVTLCSTCHRKIHRE